MADIRHRYIVGRARERPERRLRDRSNPLEELSEGQVFARYRFMPETIMFMVRLMNLNVYNSDRNSPLPPLLRLLTALRFFGCGTFYIVIGDTVNIAHSSVCRAIKEVAEALVALRRRFIQFPSGQRADVTKTAFFNLCGFPSVLSSIDCTHVRIVRPSLENSHVYINRGRKHSINVQMCCDTNFLITNVVAKWPGSVHDSRIFRNSILCSEFENGQHDGILIGDSGYPCRPFLMPPFLNPETRQEERFNGSLCRGRVVIEQCFGILKKRFACLGQCLRVSPKKAILFIYACAILHNIGILRGDICENDEELEQDRLGPQQPLPDDIIDGRGMRRHIVASYFGR